MPGSRALLAFHHTYSDYKPDQVLSPPSAPRRGCAAIVSNEVWSNRACSGPRSIFKGRTDPVNGVAMAPFAARSQPSAGGGVDSMEHREQDRQQRRTRARRAPRPPSALCSANTAHFLQHSVRRGANTHRNVSVRHPAQVSNILPIRCHLFNCTFALSNLRWICCDCLRLESAAPRDKYSRTAP